MSITDELRKWAEDNTLRDRELTTCPPQHVVRGVLETLLRIADRIDAEHEAKVSYWQGASYKDGYDEGFASADDWLGQHEDAMAEHGWVCLPKDADGEYIRIGDVLTDDAEFKSEGKVTRLMLEDEGWMVGLGCGGWTEPSIHEWHHYHEPTVEDVLMEFMNVMLRTSSKDAASRIAEYAAKLRLAGDAE